ncbi:unnamed protein product [Caenorhabditis brenneri]
MAEGSKEVLPAYVPLHKYSKSFVDAIGLEKSKRTFDDIEDDQKSLFERHEHRRPKTYFFEAKSNIRLHLRRYSLILVAFCFFPIYYSLICCGPPELEFYDLKLSSPSFNKYEPSNQCSSVKQSLRTGIMALLVFYGLKFYNKLVLSFFYLLLLFYFGWEVRITVLEWSKSPNAITKVESGFHYVNLSFRVIQTASIFPLLVGGYFLIRHIHRKSTEKEITRRQVKYEDERRTLRNRKAEMKYVEEAVKSQAQALKKQEQEDAQKRIEDDNELLVRKHRISQMEKDINERERKRNEERLAQLEHWKKTKDKERQEKREKNMKVILGAEFEED